MRIALAVPLVLIAGCKTFTAPVPFHLGETAAALREGEHAITAAAGVGMSFVPGGLGAGVRVREGLGGGHELGAELTAGRADKLGLFVAGKASWKYGLAEHVALLAGAGGAWVSRPGFSAGGDVGLVVSSSPVDLADRPWSVYAGGRVGGAVPLRQDPMLSAGNTFGGLGALGVRVGGRKALFLELGAGLVRTHAFDPASDRGEDLATFYGCLGGVLSGPGE